MEDLFRFMLLRPPSTVDAKRLISLEQDTTFQRQLRAAKSTESAAANMRAIADQKFVNTVTNNSDSRYVDSPDELSSAGKLRALGRQLRAGAPQVSGHELTDLIRDSFTAPPRDVAADPQFQLDRRSAGDSIIAIMLLRREQLQPVDAILEVLRLITLIDDVALTTELDGQWNVGDAFDRLVQLPPSIFPIPGRLGLGWPEAVPSIRPAGVADLLIVKQTLKRYDAREIAHIENVIKGETKSREHRRRTTTEEFLLTETETTTETERELESTERSEMQREVAETLKQDAKLEAGLKVSGSYGPAVKFEASVSGALSKSFERSTKHAEQYANDVTQRSANKVAERIKEQRTRRTVTEVEETNKHGLIGGSEHTVAIYQWVEKTYEAQIFNYGRRTIYEFMIPEPAAFLAKALQAQHSKLTTAALVEPPPFTLTADALTQDNYHQYVLEYEATDVTPPPERHVTLSHTFGGQTEADSRGRKAEHIVLPIAPGYRAIRASVTRSASRLSADEDNWFMSVSIGRVTHTFSRADSGYWQTALTLSDQLNQTYDTVSIPVWLRTTGVGTYAVAIEIQCEPTTRALDEWRQVTHRAIVEAWQRKRIEYAETLAALQAQAGVEISGRHPEANRLLERDELQKSCVSLFAQQPFGQLDGRGFPDIAVTSDNLFPLGPQVNLQKADEVGSLVRFFEQAFEWHNMTYLFYPYFWGSAARWVDRINYKDADPLFEAFLKAGSARVVVPVRPGFEAALDHFVITDGELWGGGELPGIGSEMYVTYIEEMSEVLGAPGDEVVQGDPWEVTLPTSLVVLRSSSTLPRWRKDAGGNWVSDE